MCFFSSRRQGTHRDPSCEIWISLSSAIHTPWHPSRKETASRNWKSLRSFCMREFFFGLHTQILFFQVSFCPVRIDDRAGSSRNEFDYYPDQFPVSRLSQLREFRTSSFSIFLIELKNWSNGTPFLINCQFADCIIEKWDSSKVTQLRLSRSGKMVWVPIRT